MTMGGSLMDDVDSLLGNEPEYEYYDDWQQEWYDWLEGYDHLIPCYWRLEGYDHLIPCYSVKYVYLGLYYLYLQYFAYITFYHSLFCMI